MAISKCLLVALVVVIFATIFQVIALAAPYWFNLDLSIAKVYAGLWWTCTETVSTGLTSCDKTVDYLFTNGLYLINNSIGGTISMYTTDLIAKRYTRK